MILRFFLKHFIQYYLEKEHIKNFINGVPFFKEFSEHERRKLTGDKSAFKQFNKDTNIFMEGDPGSSLFVTLFGSIGLIKNCSASAKKGRVSLKEGTEQIIGELESGSVFGELLMVRFSTTSVIVWPSSPTRQ